MKHANSILQPFEHMSSKSILIILSYTVSNLVRFLTRCIIQHEAAVGLNICLFRLVIKPVHVICLLVQTFCRPFTPDYMQPPCPISANQDDSWHYDANLKRCVCNFTSVVCYGIDNKFISENECMQYCIPEGEMGT